MIKSNHGLVDHAKRALSEKWGYVWGTFGMVLTEALFNQKLAQYPDGVGKYESFIRSNWMKKRTADCVGLIKSYIWWNGSNPVYDSKTDLSANGMYNAATEKDYISSLPEVPGVCLWKDGHIGVYMGDGRVIEAKGTKYGVVQTPLKGSGASSWTHWLKCPYIKHIKGDYMRNEVVDFQRRYGLVPDGIVGPVTTAKMKAVYSFLISYVGQMNIRPRIEVKQYKGAEYVEIDSLQMDSVDVDNKNTNDLLLEHDNFASGMFHNSKGRLFNLLVVRGKRIYKPKWWDKGPKGTFIVYNNGNVQTATVMDIKDISNIKLAFQGYNLDYEANGSNNLYQSIRNEGWLPDVMRKCFRVAYGYNYRIGKVVIACKNSDAYGIRSTMRSLGCTDLKNNTVAIAVDAGRKTVFAVNGKLLHHGGGGLEHIIIFGREA